MSSEEEFSGGELEVQEAQARGEDRDLKNRLFRKFGSHIGTLKLEFSKKKKKGKLPKEARQALLHWWSVHYKWPYPTVLLHYLERSYIQPVIEKMYSICVTLIFIAVALHCNS